MLKILVADDEMLERRAIKTILRKVYGDKITILEAKNGRESIEISEAFKPDIFIMDIKMPGIDGIQSIKEIKNIHKNAYFIVLTAYDYFDFAKEALECGVKEYILKPLDRSEFLKIIGKAINLIDKKKNERKEELIRMEQMCSMRPMLENQLSYLIITNNLNNIEYVECMKYLHISFQLGYCLIIRLSEKYAYYKTNTYEKKLLNIR